MKFFSMSVFRPKKDGSQAVSLYQKQKLFCSENFIARIAQARDDVAVLV